MMLTVLVMLMANDDDCPNDDDDDDDDDPAGVGGQRLEDNWMGYLLINDADCAKY
jgi:hypothetical protein